ncbi:MAG: DEAD/DEAH box helicase [Leptospiraceae bacterium]|nr:DEAD/DEAH box helicase [Leptospiraceae bacterium]MCP5495885.1 DEAD/DEAH box helicase [Leptospiraceae bacterium]
MKFEELNLNPLLQKAIDDIGFTELTPIQEQSIPHALEGEDITGVAQTGTGKTISYLIPIINKLLKENYEDPCSLIVAPTRELVAQISEETNKLLRYTDKKVSTIIGGVSYKEQDKSLQDKCDIIVATPGRLIDYIKAGNLKLNSIQFLVLDEADRMFDMGFIKDISYIIHKTPKHRQTMMYSATLSYYSIRVASDYLKEPVEIKIESDNIAPENIDQKIIHLGRQEKLPYLINLILNDETEGLGIIFTNLKMMVGDLVNSLRNYGIAVTGISSLLEQKKRVKLLKEFKLGKYQYMVATDVASRGLDIDNVKVVYNFDLPMDAESYVHRIGRTARAGKKGLSLSMCSEKDYTELEKIERLLNYKIPTMEINEDYLTFPKGKFVKFLEIGHKASNNEKTIIKNKKSESKKFKTYHRNLNLNKEEKSQKLIAPIEEAKIYLQKADLVLNQEVGKNVKPIQNQKRNFDKKKKNTKPGNSDRNDISSSYNKSKRNLFDINDLSYRENKKSTSIWKKIKSLFGR